MRYDWEISVECIATVAKGLGDLLERVVFVGGATLGFYVDQLPEKLMDVRGSEDVDLVVEISTRAHYADLEASLRRRGFNHDQTPGAPICRFLFAGVKVDVMPTDPSILSFSNTWYSEGMKRPDTVEVPSGMHIKILSPPYFLAAKFEAFLGRGKKPGEYMYSRDLEDVVTLFDGRTPFVSEITATSEPLRSYLRDNIGTLLADAEFRYAISALVKPDERAANRIRIVRERMADALKHLS
jgi:predicted nucleotidyltransferase